jgi:arylsulfotransferase ASST
VISRGCCIVCVSLLAACERDTIAPPPPEAPVILTADAVTNPANALSATVRVHARAADSVAVRFVVGDSYSANDSSTAAVGVAGDSAVIPVFGLSPNTRYTLHAIAFGPGGATTGESIHFTTDTLPSDLPRYTASGSDPSPGYIVFAAGRYGLVIDNTGRVVWYYRFPYGPGLAFIAQANGHYVARPATASPSTSDPWVEIDPSGNIVRTRGCALGLGSRPHDLIIDHDGGHWLMCDETRTMDLLEAGGVAGARVTGTSIQHLDKSGNVIFSWSPFDHFDITDGEQADRKGTNVNWTHGNAIDFDLDGNLLVSFRNLNEITKIDVATGAIIWRLGGRRNQFAFVNASAPAFLGQHSVRSAGAGQLMFLDNVGNPRESRAEMYTIDEPSKTAMLARDFESSPAVVTQIGGSVQRLPGGHTLVSFGTAGRVEEYNAAGQVVWHIDGNAGYVFRAQRVTSLYTPGVGTSR